MESSESRNAPSPGPASDDSVPPLNRQPDAAEPAGQASPRCSGAEGGASRGPPGSFAFDPVPLRRREDGLTPEKQRAYVEVLADTGVAREAAARVGLTEQSINRVRRRADARSFDLACEAAHRRGARRLRSIAFERAIEGTVKGHHYHGELISEERVHDNRLLIYLLGKTEHWLDPPEETRAICDNWEPYMDALELGLPPPVPGEAEGPGLAPPSESASFAPDEEFNGTEVWEGEDGTWWTEFPPPAGFDGEEQGEFGDDDYKRTLTSEEQAVIDADLDDERAEQLAAECDRRDRFFGFAGDAISSFREAEPYETSGDEGPIEIKSATPCASLVRPVPSPRCRARARHLGAIRRARHVPGTKEKSVVSGTGQAPLRDAEVACPRRAPRRTFPPPRSAPR